MRVVTGIEDIRRQCVAARQRGERIGLVPTRGDLHDGHIALLRVAHAQCGFVICSIVRPDGTPAVHETRDERYAADGGAHLVWRPAPGPLRSDAALRIIPSAAPSLEPVATAAAQLLGIVRPDAVYVGEEHYEHARTVRSIVAELGLAIDVRVVDAPRDLDGIAAGEARSLSPRARDAAAAVPRTLDAISASVSAGERSLFRLRARAEAHLADGGALLHVDDVATIDARTHEPVDVFDRDVLLVISARVDGVAIIDSRLLSPDPLAS